jgi:hypothetical protein
MAAMHSSIRSSFRRLLPLLLLAASLVTARAQSLPTWRETTPTALLSGANIYGLAYGNGTFVASASSNNPVADFFLTSPDGSAWTRVALPAGISGIRQVRFINGKFWTVGGNGAGSSTVYTSTNGSAWTAVQTVQIGGLGTGGGLVDIAYGNGAYVAPLDLGWLTSADGVTWTARSAPTPTGGGTLSAATGVAFANGVFVASFASVSTVTSMFRSTDGLTWTPIPTLTTFGGYTRVFVFNNQFVVYERSNINPSLQGQGLASTDGLTWTRTGTTTNPYAGSGVTGVGNGYRVAISGVPALGNFRVAMTTNNATFTDIGITPVNRSVDRGFAVGDTAIVGLTASSQLVTGDAPAAPATAPVIATQPAAVSAVLGRTATLSVAAGGTGHTYQWRLNNTAIAGATAATYTIASVTAASAGSYTVAVTNSVGTTVSAPALLTLVSATSAGRLINLSVLTTIATATDEFTLGYVVGGTGTTGPKPLVIRAAGPSLGALGVPGTLSDPKLETFAGTTSTGVNDNWGGGTQLTADLAAVGAFAYTGPTSRDAAVSTSLTSRDNSVKVTGVNGTTGQVIAEVYDATPSANFAVTTPRLLNVSVRKHLGTGVTAGFVLGGATSTRVLIRVVGPGLAAFGVPDTVVDPQLALFDSSSTKIGENNDWGGSAELTAAANSVGAFALPAATSKDAALVVSLPPGGYSVQASGLNNTTGVALVEVYELP